MHMLVLSVLGSGDFGHMLISKLKNEPKFLILILYLLYYYCDEVYLEIECWVDNYISGNLRKTINSEIK